MAFSGNLDAKTLGGSGFASQRTTEDGIWDLCEYQGIELFVKPQGCEGMILTSSNSCKFGPTSCPFKTEIGFID